MSALICTLNDPYFFYDIQSESQAVAMMSFWFMLFSVEIVFVVQTFRLFSSGAVITRLFIFRLVYVLLHASFVSFIVYLPGGLVCYNPYFYEVIGPLHSETRTLAILLLLYFMLTTNRELFKYKLVQCFLEISLLLTILAVAGVYVVLQYLSLLWKDFTPLMYLGVTQNVALTLFLLVISTRQYLAMKRVVPKVARKIALPWIAFTVLLALMHVFMVLRSFFLYTLITVKGNTEFVNGLCMVVVLIITELIPGLLVVLFTNLQQVHSEWDSSTRLLADDTEKSDK